MTSQRPSQSMRQPRPPSRAETSSGASVARELVGAEVLVIDRDEGVRSGMTELLSEADLHVTAIEDPALAWELLDRKFFSVVVVDLDTPQPNAGLETIETVRMVAPTSAVVVLTPRKSFGDAVDAVRAGAIDVILKAPDAVEYLKQRIHEAAVRSLDRRQVNAALRDTREVGDALLKGFMEAERRALDLADQVSGRHSRVTHTHIRILVVAKQADLATKLAEHAGPTYDIQSAQTGGSALDRATSGQFHVVMISDDLDDLPASMVTRSIKGQAPDTMVLLMSRAADGAVVEMIEGDHKALLASKLKGPDQLAAKLDDLTEVFRLRERERRYLQAFRERHYDLLRRYAATKTRIDKIIGS